MNKRLWLVKAPQFSIIGFILFNIFAMLAYPGGTLDNPSILGFSFFNNFLSDLGRFNSWGQSQNFYSQLFFNSTMIIAGIVFAFFFLNLHTWNFHVWKIKKNIYYILLQVVASSKYVSILSKNPNSWPIQKSLQEHLSALVPFRNIWILESRSCSFWLWSHVYQKPIKTCKSCYLY